MIMNSQAKFQQIHLTAEISDIQLPVRNVNKRNNLARDIQLKNERNITSKPIKTENCTAALILKRAKRRGALVTTPRDMVKK